MNSHHFDVDGIRQVFPQLQRLIDNLPLVYLDSAATSLKPECVIEAIVDYYKRYTSNVKRGVHALGDEATDRFDDARGTVGHFINAGYEEIVFTRNTTDSINLVARSYPQTAKVLFGVGEHHSNYLPWAHHTQGIPVATTPTGTIDMDELQQLLDKERPALVAISYETNSSAAVNPIKEIVAVAHAHDCRVLVDASQAVPHRPINVRDLDCDYLCFSGHKMCGPTGIGVLYAKRECLRELRPQNFGGSMVKEVHVDGYSLAEFPWRLEAGTPFIEGAIGLAAACDFLDEVGREQIHRHCQELVRHALASVQDVRGLKIFGPTDPTLRGASVAFTISGVEAHGIARILSNRYNICVRSGYQCAQPSHERAGLGPTIRASFYLYNTLDEVDFFCRALRTVVNQFDRW